MKIQDIIVDLVDFSVVGTFYANVKDKNSTTLSISVLNKGQNFALDDCAAKYDAAIGNKKVAEKSEATIEDNKVIITLTPELVEEEGILIIDLCLFVGSSIVLAPSFCGFVQKGVK